MKLFKTSDMQTVEFCRNILILNCPATYSFVAIKSSWIMQLQRLI